MRVTQGPEHGLTDHQVVITSDDLSPGELYEWLEDLLFNVDEWEIRKYELKDTSE